MSGTIRSLVARAGPLLRSDGLRGRLLRGGLGSVGVTFGSKFLGLGVTIVLARALGADGYGLYAYVFVLVSLLAIPAQLGLPTLVVRETARAQATGSWGLMRGVWRWSSLAAGALSVSLATAALVFSMSFANRLTDLQMATFSWALLLVPLVALGNLRGAALRGLRRVIEGMLPEHILRPLLLIVFVLLAMLLWPDHEMTAATAMALHALAALVAFLVGALLLWRCRPTPLAAAPPAVFTHRAWISASIPLSLLSAMQVANMQVGLLVIGLLGTAADVALLRVATQAATLVVIGQTAVNMLVAPYFARYHASGNVAALQKIVAVSALGSLSLALPASLLLWLYSKQLLLFFLGAEFVGASVPLAILIAGQLLNTCFGSVGVLLNMTGFEKDAARGLAVAAVANGCLCLALVPLLGVQGAALASAISTVVWNLYWWVLVQARLKVTGGLFAFWPFRLSKGQGA